MNEETAKQLTAAILTLSEGLDAMHEIMRKELSFNVDLHGTKIQEKFIPEPLIDTQERFRQWKDDGKTPV